jgi:Aspartyl protease
MAELQRINPEHPRLRTDVILNGKRIDAILDTGAQGSLITRHAAQSVGVIAGQGSAVAHGAITGVAGVPLEAWSGSFETFSIGDESMRNVKLTIADLFTGDAEVKTGSRIAQPIEGLPSMVVGCDFFLSHRILISAKEHKLLFTYNGGPVFRFVEGGEAPKSATEHADGNPVPAASTPKSH